MNKLCFNLIYFLVLCSYWKEGYMFRILLLANVVVLSFYIVKAGNPFILGLTVVLFLLACFFENNIRQQSRQGSNKEEVDTMYLPNLVLARIFELSIVAIGTFTLLWDSILPSRPDSNFSIQVFLNNFPVKPAFCKNVAKILCTIFKIFNQKIIFVPKENSSIYRTLVVWKCVDADKRSTRPVNFSVLQIQERRYTNRRTQALPARLRRKRQNKLRPASASTSGNRASPKGTHAAYPSGRKPASAFYRFQPHAGTRFYSRRQGTDMDRKTKTALPAPLFSSWKKVRRRSPFQTPNFSVFMRKGSVSPYSAFPSRWSVWRRNSTGSRDRSIPPLVSFFPAYETGTERNHFVIYICHF